MRSSPSIQSDAPDSGRAAAERSRLVCSGFDRGSSRVAGGVNRSDPTELRFHPASRAQAAPREPAASRGRSPRAARTASASRRRLRGQPHRPGGQDMPGKHEWAARYREPQPRPVAARTAQPGNSSRTCVIPPPSKVAHRVPEGRGSSFDARRAPVGVPSHRPAAGRRTLGLAIPSPRSATWPS